MKNILVALLFISGCQSNASSLVGQTVPPYPAGYSSDWGKCIATGADICAYAISTLHDASGDVVGVLAEQPVDNTSVPRFRILDQMPAPKLGPGEIWVIGACQVDGREDPAVIGIVTYKDMGGWIEAEDTTWAIRFNFQTRKLEEIATTNVECQPPGS